MPKLPHYIYVHMWAKFGDGIPPNWVHTLCRRYIPIMRIYPNAEVTVTSGICCLSTSEIYTSLAPKKVATSTYLIQLVPSIVS